MHETLAATVWARVLPHLLEKDIRDVTPVGFGTQGTWLPIGVNHCFLFSRYKEGQFFKPHFDGMYKNDMSDCSVFTITIYLNDNFKGGRVQFLPEQGEGTSFFFTPKTGSALIFNHDTLHEGETVSEGTKYILRTSIMFRRVEALSDPLRGWEQNTDWQRMREVFSTFDVLNVSKDPSDFTRKYLECQAIQIANGRSIHEPTPLPLPEDVFVSIFNLLSLVEIASTLRVSKAWKSIARSGRLWRDRLQKNFALSWDSIKSSDRMLSKADASIVDWFSIYRRIHFTAAVAEPVGVFVGKDLVATRLDGSKVKSFPAKILDLSDPWDYSFTHWRVSVWGQPATDHGHWSHSVTQLLISHAAEKLLPTHDATAAGIMLVINPESWRQPKEGDDPKTWETVKSLVERFRREKAGNAFGVITQPAAALVASSTRSGVVVSCHRTGNTSSSTDAITLVLNALYTVGDNKRVKQRMAWDVRDVADLLAKAPKLIADACKEVGQTSVVFVTGEDPNITKLKESMRKRKDTPPTTTPQPWTGMGTPKVEEGDSESDSDYDFSDPDYMDDDISQLNPDLVDEEYFYLEISDLTLQNISLIKNSIKSAADAELQFSTVNPTELAQAAIRAPFLVSSYLSERWIYKSTLFEAMEQTHWESRPANPIHNLL